MRIETYLSGRLIRGKKADFSRPVVRIATLSVALGLACMILSVTIVTGFQHAIRDKVAGFAAHVRLSRFDNNLSYELQPVSRRQDFIPTIRDMGRVKSISVFATKPGIIKTEEEMEGVVLKGIGPDYDWTFLRDKISGGGPLPLDSDSLTTLALVSRKTAKRLHLEPGDPLRLYFIQEGQNTPRARRLSVGGIYETGLEEFDQLFVFCDIRVIQKLNDWTPDQVGGFEIMLEDFASLPAVYPRIYQLAGYSLDARPVTALYPALFDWLELMDMNVLIILVLMTVISAMTMISTFLILILERTNMIGILKALGATNAAIRRLFLLQGAYILLRGMFWGNLIGLGFSLLQLRYGLIRLAQESYYVSSVPVKMQFLPLFALNAATLAACLLLMLLPSYTIARLSPLKTIRYR